MILTFILLIYALGYFLFISAVLSICESVDYETRYYCMVFDDVTPEDLKKSCVHDEVFDYKMSRILFFLAIPGAALAVGVCLYATMHRLVPDYVSGKAAEIRAARRQEILDEDTVV